MIKILQLIKIFIINKCLNVRIQKLLQIKSHMHESLRYNPLSKARIKEFVSTGINILTLAGLAPWTKIIK